jgi:hypothetical protein
MTDETDETDETEERPKVVALGVDWPGRPLPMMPGDFSRIVPHGVALSVTPILRPWDDPVRAMSMPDYYGLEPVRMDPLGAAPLTDALGGVIYFDQWRPQEWLDGAFSCMGVHLDDRDYGVFQGEGANFLRDRYLDQVRIASKRALGHLFGIGAAELAQIPTQPVSIGDYIRQFFAEQNCKWTDWSSDRTIHGVAGGDGDWAKEALGFGFMVENGYWGVYRLWSRAWLATK